MRVAGDGLDLVVAEQFSDHGQPFPGQQAAAGEGVAQVVDAHVFNARAPADRDGGVEYVGREFARLHEGNAIRYRLSPADLASIPEVESG